MEGEEKEGRVNGAGEKSRMREVSRRKRKRKEERKDVGGGGLEEDERESGEGY